ncbi:MAG: PA0069 family radical SAM protein [Alphaproteobacteria bacterium]|nr:PA0069 family radical SAM protein [Alphaproteobacteria bacterium]
MATGERNSVRPETRRGRGTASNDAGRFEALRRAPLDDGWSELDGELAPLKTTVEIDSSRSIVARNDSPDIPFDRSINPYRGCEHGCVYCYARPSHAYLGLSTGLDFETRLFMKPEAAVLLRAELAKPGYRPAVMALGSNTDPYQPIEKRWQVTRQILEVLAECDHPVGITTKAALVTRDIDLLAAMAKKRLAKVYLSVTTLDRALARRMEPRASTPERRLDAIAALAEAGIPTGIMTAPLIPGLNDHELEALLEAAAERGAIEAGYTFIRLPHEIKDLFRDWLAEHYPNRSARVIHHIQQARGGRDNDPEFFSRMHADGPYARLISKRFRLACKRLGLNAAHYDFDTSLFKAPRPSSSQLTLI